MAMTCERCGGTIADIGGHIGACSTGWKSKVFVGEDMIPIKREMDRLRREVRDLSDENYRLKHELDAEDGVSSTASSEQKTEARATAAALSTQIELRTKILEAFPCIDVSCDQQGTIPHQVSDNEWEPEQCQFCWERRFPAADQILSVIESSNREARLSEVQRFPATSRSETLGYKVDRMKELS